MGSFGENLRSEREARGIALEDISATTKISVRLLRAIENEEFDRLPGGVFNINFVRQYARQVGLDEDKIVNEYRRLTSPAPPEAAQQESAPRAPVIPAEWTETKSSEYEWDQQRQSRVWVIAAGVMVALALGASAYLWLAGRKAATAPAPHAHPCCTSCRSTVGTSR